MQLFRLMRFVNNSTHCYIVQVNGLCVAASRNDQIFLKNLCWYIKHYDFHYIDPEYYWVVNRSIAGNQKAEILKWHC